MTTRMPIRVAHGLVHVRRGEVPVRLLNPSAEPIIIHKGTQIATMEGSASRPLICTNGYGSKRTFNVEGVFGQRRLVHRCAKVVTKSHRWGEKFISLAPSRI